MKKLLPCLAAVLLIASLTKTALCVPFGYDIVDLGAMLSTGISSAADINNNGQVIGQGPSGAFLYSSGTMTNLGANKNVYCINNTGQVVGEASGAAFLYSDGTTTILGQGTTAAYGINDSGLIVGAGNFVVNSSGQTAIRGFIYDNGDITPLGTLNPASNTNPSFTSNAYYINNSGQVVGKASASNSYTTNAFLYANSLMSNLGTLGGDTSTANVINNSGQIVGWSDKIHGTHADNAFLYSSGMTDLSSIIFNGSYATRANDINNLGQAVGNAAGISGGATAFIYDGSTMRDLNSLITSSNYYITAANGINDLGQIVATGKYLPSSFYTRALLLTPAQRTWDGGGTNDNWSTPANWNPDTVPVNGSALTFSGVNRQTNINDTDLISVGLITFSNGGFNISGHSLVLNAGIINNGDNTWAINSSLASPQTFTSLSGTLTISGNVNNNGNLMSIDGAGNHLISGAIAGNGGLYKSGSGTLTLSSTANNYKDNTTVNGGVLEFTGGVNIDSTEMIDVKNGKAVFKTTNVNNSALNIATDIDGTFEIVDGVHTVGNIEGSGTTAINGQLTANSINQDVLTLAIGSRVTIAPLPGGPMAENTQLIPVPEPATLILAITGILFLFISRRVRK